MNADDLSKILDELGRRLGPAGSHVFELAVRQVYINAVTASIFAAIVVGLAVAGVPRLYRWVQGHTGSYTNDREIVAVLIGAIYCFPLLGAVVWLFTAVPAAFNPEYAAIRDLLSAIPR